jgi:hypothetical protein
MSSFLRLFAAGVIVAGVVVWGLTEVELGSDSPPDPAAAVRLDNTGAVNEKDGQANPEVADLRSQVALLRSDLDEVQRQLRQLVQSASQAPLSVKPSSAEEPADAIVLSEQELREQEADMIEAENQRSLARMAAGEAALQQESADGVWSIQAAEALREALASEALSGTAVQDIDCRSTLCRLQVVHDNREQQALFEHGFSFKVGQLLPRMMMHSEEQTDGTISATMYLAREGNELPRSD